MKTIKESMNLDYSDFDYKKFENWIIRYLEDYGCEVNTVEIICDDYGYDVEINVENAENLPSRISDKDYGAFIFDAMYTTNCLYLKMPIVRAMKIAEEFSPKVLKVNDDSILIGDKNSDTEIWLDVWTDNDGDEDYTEWDYNQQSFNLNNYEDMVQKYLQQIDDFFYILDGVVSDNFPLTESKKINRKSIEESKVMTFEEFKKLCNDNFGYAIMDFNEYKGAYFVIVSADEKTAEKFTKILHKNGLECSFYELQDPYNEYYLCYEIMCV